LCGSWLGSPPSVILNLVQDPLATPLKNGGLPLKSMFMDAEPSSA
jgi:hypothetical protein